MEVAAPPATSVPALGSSSTSATAVVPSEVATPPSATAVHHARNDAGATNRVGRKGTEWALERRDQQKNAKRGVGRCIGGRRGAVGGRPMELRDGSEGRTEIGRSEGDEASGFASHRGCTAASGFGVVLVDRIVTNILVVQIFLIFYLLLN